MIKWAFAFLVLASLGVIGALLYEAFKVLRDME